MIKTSESWAVRYRPRKLSDFVGQPEAVALLKGMQKRKEFPNAILITGPTGSGKTTLARLISAIVNDLEGENVDNNPDTIEINIGTENRVDNARELNTKLDFVAKRNFRVFILDEIHKQTDGAASALLKSIEEPPPHVIFVLVTNLPSKLLPTTRNRCVEINLKAIDSKDIFKILERVAKKEKLKIDKKMIEKISEYSSGNPRESIQMLQAVANLIAGGFDPKKAVKESILSIGSHAIEKVAIKFLLGAYTNDIKKMIGTIYDTDDHAGLLRVMTELHAYLPAYYTNGKTYHSPPRRTLVKVLENATNVEMPQVAKIHHEIIESRLSAGTYLVPERDVLLSLAYRLA